MNPRSLFRICVAVVLPVTGAMTGFQVCAAQIWNGALTSFELPAGADWTQSANQDHLTDNVWLTRATTGGLFNAANETNYASLFSPANTEWSYGLLANYSSLTYASWEAWNGHSPPSMVGKDAVVHLVSDDIYLSIHFNSWGGINSGFSYLRSTPAAVPEPSVAAMLQVSLCILLVAKLGRSVSRMDSPKSVARFRNLA